jgi:phage gpG-like protein
MSTFKIDVQDSAVLAAFNRLQAAAVDPGPLFRAIGEALVVQAKRTFKTGTDPWGRRWLPNSPVTIAAMLARRKGNFRKRDGKLSAKGAKRVMAKRPLIGESRQLSTRIHYALDGNTLTVGSSMIQAAMQQFGGRKSEFPKLWGDIPARPFLPITAAGDLAPEARREVLEAFNEVLAEAWRG